jgi:hypothetical protein
MTEGAQHKSATRRATRRIFKAKKKKKSTTPSEEVQDL